MNKQEFLAMSLPYQIKVQLNHKGVFNLDEEYSEPHNEICEVVNMLRSINSWDYEISDDKISYGYIGLDEFNLILHPLSDLTKEIEHNGQTFVPSLYLNTDFEDLIKLPETYRFLQFNIALKLAEWHFDLADLISKGEAIDINTIEENPYR